MLVIGAAATPARADLVFRVGDTVYVDGKRYSWDEWQKIRASSDRLQPAQAVASSTGGSPPGAAAAHAASCITPISYSAFPGDEERFACSAGLGSLTRDELSRAGWRVDYVERVAAPPMEGGAPLYKYKLVISR